MHGDEKKLSQIPIFGNYLASFANAHLEHHGEVDTDMRLNTVKRVTGLFFKWEITVWLSVITALVLFVCGLFDIKYSLLFGTLFALIYSMLWNTIHPKMHDFKLKLKLKDGIPEFKGINMNNPMYQWLWYNHAIHHLQKDNKGNYNIVFPGADFLLGTYHNKCYDNVEFCKKQKNPTTKKRVCSNKAMIKRCLNKSDIFPTQYKVT